MKKNISRPIVALSLVFYSLNPQSAKADLFGGDVVVLSQILIQAIAQVKMLTQVFGQARETVGILQEMNRGVKEVIRLADTAHIPLPEQVYSTAKQINQAAETAKKLYGAIDDHAPGYTKNDFKSGIEGLFLSADALDYSTFLDNEGNKVKSASIIASQATATRLSAQTLGVLVHAISHGNRIEAKQLELNSTKKIEETSKENAKFESFTETQKSIATDMKKNGFRSLNNISDAGD